MTKVTGLPRAPFGLKVIEQSNDTSSPGGHFKLPAPARCAYAMET